MNYCFLANIFLSLADEILINNAAGVHYSATEKNVGAHPRGHRHHAAPAETFHRNSSGYMTLCTARFHL